jgi:phage-related protein
MPWIIEYHSKTVESFLLGLPAGLLARYLRLTDLMLEFGADLGMPHTRALGGGLFELRFRAREGVGRVLYCTLPGQRIRMLRGFIKKTARTPHRELLIARRLVKEIERE